MHFQKIILIVGVIFLVVVLLFIARALNKSNQPDVWPPVIGDCPDYWIDMSGNGAACLNKKKLGKCNVPYTGDMNTMNFNVPPFNSSGKTGMCSKYTWATNCNVTWDGITYGVPNPCADEE